MVEKQAFYPFFVSAKFGDKLPPGAVIKNRVPTGEVVGVNAPGRDAIVARVIWLRGMETQNRGARDRCIYIHGTPEEGRIDKPASFGCIRMRSRDVIALYDRGGIERPSRSVLIRPLGLTENEKADLIAFLHTLTSASQPVSFPVLPR